MMVSIFPDLTGLVYMIVVPGVRNDPTHQRERRSQMVWVHWWFWCQCGWVGWWVPGIVGWRYRCNWSRTLTWTDEVNSTFVKMKRNRNCLETRIECRPIWDIGSWDATDMSWVVSCRSGRIKCGTLRICIVLERGHFAIFMSFCINQRRQASVWCFILIRWRTKGEFFWQKCTLSALMS